jgi:hypothetical protein
MSTTPVEDIKEPTADEVALMKSYFESYNQKYKDLRIKEKIEIRHKGTIGFAAGGVVCFILCFLLFSFLASYDQETNGKEGVGFLIFIFFVGWAVAPALMWTLGINNLKDAVKDAESKLASFAKIYNMDIMFKTRKAYPALFE